MDNKYFIKLINTMLNEINNFEASKNNPDLHLKGTYFYEEGWLLRLFLFWYSRNSIKFTMDVFPKSDKDNVKWYSEACINSPYSLSKKDGDNKNINDGTTYADAVIGDFKRKNKSKIYLDKDTKEFYILEAKVNSKLSPGVNNRKAGYSQATRNIACLINEMYLAKINLDSISKIGLYVLTPENNKHLDQIRKCMNHKSIERELISRNQGFIERIINQERKQNFLAFMEYMNQVLQSNKLVIQIITWEEIIGKIRDENFLPEFKCFYKKTLIENNVKVD